MSLREPIAFDNVSIFEERAAKLLSYTSESTKPCVAVWGVMNAGKSYLLNMLTDHIQVEYFPTNDVRETAEIKIFESSRFRYLDTPGLDANSADDALAIAGADAAELVLFVHQPIGELDQIELDCLKKLKMAFGEQAEQCILVVLSKADAEPAEKVASIEARIKEQLDTLLNFKPRCFQVSGARFHKGVQQHKEGLVRASQVGELKSYIDTLSVDLVNIRKVKQKQRLELLLKEIKGALDVMGQHMVATQEQLDLYFNDFNQAITDLTESLDGKSKSLRKLLKSGV